MTVNFHPALKVDKELYTLLVRYIARDYSTAAGLYLWQDPMIVRLQEQSATVNWLGSSDRELNLCTCMVIPARGTQWLKANSSIIAHEMAHAALWRIFTGDHKIGTNACHYALNAGWQLVRKKNHKTYKEIQFVVLDLKKIMQRINTICSDVAAGCAPLGKDAYV